MKVKLTKLQIGEIAHKLAIVRDEPELQADYSISQTEANALAEYFWKADAGDGVVEFDVKYLDMIIEELHDVNNVHLSNWQDTGDQGSGGLYRSVCDAIKRLTAAGTLSVASN